MTYQLGKRSPEAMTQALGQAQRNKEALAETSHTSLGYSGGTPVPPSSREFAGDIIGGNLGVMGEFATALRSPDGQANLQAFTELLYNGPFSPLPPPIM